MDNYYSVARIRALETELLSNEQVDRMASANDLESAFNLLAETGYGQHLALLKDSFDFEAMFGLESAKTKKLFAQLSGSNDPFEHPCPMLKNYKAAIIDLNNLRSFLSNGLDKTNFIPNGLIDLMLFQSLQKTSTDIIAKLIHTPYIPFLNPGLNAFFETNQANLLDKLIDDLLVNIMKPAKYRISGIEPLVGYLLAKDNEIKNLRLILNAKKQKVGSDKIIERVRSNY